MPIIRTLTLTEFENRLRSLGIPMCRETAKLLIEQGLFAGIAYKKSGNDYLILAKELDEWIAAHAEEAEPTDDMLKFAEKMKGGVQS